jgi:hypothetical protein
MKDIQLMFIVSGFLPNGQEIKRQLCTTHTVLNLYVMGSVISQLERVSYAR